MTSQEERNKELLREWLKECFIGGNLDRLEEYVSPEYVEHNPSVPHDIEGIEGHRANIEGFQEAFPDMEVEIEKLVAAGDKTAQRMTFRGTHQGEMMGVPPTGKTVEATATGITRFEDGKMVEDWSQVDMLGLMQQLGVAPEPDAASE